MQSQTEENEFRGKYFGTDGFRGEAGVNLTAEHAFRIGRFLGLPQDGRRVRVLIGKDTRRSCYQLEYALAAGVAASGGDACLLHVVPTPGVSWLCSAGKYDYGVMISASHNPYYDNGIKIVNRKGEKAEDALLARIEAWMDSDTVEPAAVREKTGCVYDCAEIRERYARHLLSLATDSLAGQPFTGLRVGLDCANGAAWRMAPFLFRQAGATVYTIGDAPDGLNINAGVGSTHIDALCRIVWEHGLDCGFAFDGDADRCIAVDGDGNEVDGDKILYLFARKLQKEGKLRGNTVVITAMSNLGLSRALEQAGIDCVRTAVGDRFIYECMAANDYVLGGEQSGHILLRDREVTGDGILTALLLAGEMIGSGFAFRDALREMTAQVVSYPQLTESVRVHDKNAALADAAVQAEAERVRVRLGKNGRLVLRKSGTEPVVRVMVEAQDEAICRACCDGLIALLKAAGKGADR